MASLAADLPVGRITRQACLVAAYALPAAAVWAVAGLVLTALPLRAVALVLIPVYAAYYGLVEAQIMPGLPAPGTGWQVPQSLVRGRSLTRRLLTWGSILGSGFLTRNPYAGFALLPLVVASTGSIRAGVALAAIIGAVHGAARALALSRDAVAVGDPADYLDSVLKSIYWRTADGYALLVIAGFAIIACARWL